MRFAKAYAVAFSSLLAIPLLAQQSVPSVTQSSPQRDLKAVGILEQSFLAMGGANLASISSVTMVGQIARQFATQQATGTMTFKWGGSNLCRLDLTFDSSALSYVVNNHAAMRIEDGVSQRLPLHATLNHPIKYLPVLTEASAWTASNYSISYIGLESLNGAQVHHIHVEESLPGMSQRTAALYTAVSGVELFIDANSRMLIKRAQQLPSDSDMGSTTLLEQYFSSYVVNNGISIPHQISEYLRGQKVSDIQVTSVLFNQAVSSSDFEVR